MCCVEGDGAERADFMGRDASGCGSTKEDHVFCVGSSPHF